MHDLMENVIFLKRALRARLEDLQSSGMTFVPNPGIWKIGAVDMKVDEHPTSAKSETETLIDALLRSKGSSKEKLTALKNDILGDCRRCGLCNKISNLVFGVGSSSAKLVFVGEAPGAEEDARGEPFVGRSGKLLTKMIQAMGFERSEVYICNVVKCRPPENRDPEPGELLSCEPFLKAQLAIIQPKVIVALGRYACQCLLRTKKPMSQIRGEWSTYEGISLMPTFHPAYLLRSPGKKKEVWEDLQAVMKVLG